VTQNSIGVGVGGVFSETVQNLMNYEPLPVEISTGVMLVC
jgi:hypothetical protein